MLKASVQICTGRLIVLKHIFVSVLPKAPTLQASTNATTLLNNTTVTLSCNSANPQALAKYFLYRNDKCIQKLMHPSTNFSIKGNTPSASGSYECRVQEGNVNSSLSNKVELNFVGRKHLMLSQTLLSLSNASFTKHHLSCFLFNGWEILLWKTYWAFFATWFSKWHLNSSRWGFNRCRSIPVSLSFCALCFLPQINPKHLFWLPAIPTPRTETVSLWHALAVLRASPITSSFKMEKAWRPLAMEIHTLSTRQRPSPPKASHTLVEPLSTPSHQTKAAISNSKVSSF